MTRRQAVIALAAFLVACDRAPRCSTCGMKLDPSSPWRAELSEDGRARAFDTPRCALVAWDKGGRKGALSLQEFYDRAPRPASELRFVAGSDVLGPMGAELVPVAPDHVEKFRRDHGGAKVLALEALTAEDLR